MKRVKDWEARLDRYFASRMRRAFQFGEHDCCIFASFGLIVQGGPNLMKGIRMYRGPRGAASRLAKVGGLEVAARKRLARAGLHECAPGFAGRGCPVLADVETPDGPVLPAMGLVALDGTAAWFAGADGLVRIPPDRFRLAWRFD